MNKRQAFSVLGLPITATRKEVKKQYNQLALLLHPDNNKTPNAEEQFTELSNAYQTLMDHLIESSEAQAHATEPSRRNNNTRTPEQSKPESQDTNLFIQLRSELFHLARNTGNLSEARETELFALITRHPHFLTWALDDTGATFLHHAFAANHTPLINELIKLPQWETLSKTKIFHNGSWPGNQKNNWTLFDQIAATGQEEYYALLKPSNTDKASWVHALTVAIEYGQERFCDRLLRDGVMPDATSNDEHMPLTLAASKGYASICVLLLQFGANPQIKIKISSYSEYRGYFSEEKTPEQYWSGARDANPFTQLRSELIHLARNTGDLSETRKTGLFALITRHPHFLTWALDDTGATFLHHAFAANHTPLINELVKLPQWDALSKTENIRNKKRRLENTTPIIPLFEEWQVSQSLVTLGIFATTADESQSFIEVQKSGIDQNAADFANLKT